MYMGPGWDHTAWQPIFKSFIAAWKADGDASTMTLGDCEPYAVGAMWYRTILMGWNCYNDDGGVDNKSPKMVYEKPDGYDVGEDAINWAFIIDSGISDGYQIRIVSNESVLQTVAAVDGLNAGYVVGMQQGNQRVELVDPNGVVAASAIGTICVLTNCPDTIYNMNYQVAPLKVSSQAEPPLPCWQCLISFENILPLSQSNISRELSDTSLNAVPEHRCHLLRLQSRRFDACPPD